MQRSFIAIALLALVALATASRTSVSMQIAKSENRGLVPVRNNVGDSSWCPTCVNFMGQAINQLINIIIQVGIEGGCQAICQLLPSPLEQTVCNILCDLKGIQYFIDLVNDEDPDPVWICMELTVCPTRKGVQAKILSITPTPTSAKRGDLVTINMSFQMLNTSGTATAAIYVIPPNSDGGDPFGSSSLLVDAPAGQYTASIHFHVKPNQDEPFTPGVYKIEGAICEGDCGSHHAIEYTMTKGFSQFTVVKS